MHKNGQVAIVETRGNADCHVILRGGKAPNYDAASIAAACREIEAAKLPCTLMVDCSHANSGKLHSRQIDVARDVAAQLEAGSRCIFGVMVESHLQAGAQKFAAGKDDPAKLAYGQSITDACLGWDDSVRTLEMLSSRGRDTAAVSRRRRRYASAGVTAADGTPLRDAIRALDRVVQRLADRRADQHLDAGDGVAVLVVPVVAGGRRRRGWR